MKAKRAITENDYLTALAEATSARPPDGAFTKLDASMRTGMQIKTIACRLQADVDAGRLQTGIFLHKSKLTRFYWVAK